jgi:hypothetical protein
MVGLKLSIRMFDTIHFRGIGRFDSHMKELEGEGGIINKQRERNDVLPRSGTIARDG